MYIIIDTSSQLLYTGILSGHPAPINALCAGFETVFKENGLAGKYHWSKLSRKAKDRLRKPLVMALSKAERVNFNILQHRKPAGVERKRWFLDFLPTKIAQRLERWLDGKQGNVELIVDDDYNVLTGGNGTERFIESLLRQISLRLTNKMATIRKEGKMKMTLKQANGKILNIFASVAQKDSTLIGIADVYLGVYISEKNLFSGLKNVYFMEIK